jgi:lipoprotein-anchoring transpeptidase ErfK/SrfK
VRKWVIGIGAILVLVSVGAGSLWAYDRSQSDMIAKGVRVDGIDVGGLSRAAATAKLQQRLSRPLQRAVVFQGNGRTYTLTPAQAGAHVDVSSLVDQAVDESRSGNIVSRLTRELDGGSLNARVPLKLTLSPGAVNAFVDKVQKAVRRPAIPAQVIPSAGGLRMVHDKLGLNIRRQAMMRQINYALTVRWAPHSYRVPTKVVKASPTLDQLAKRYAAYIIVDRSAYTLRLYQHLHLTHTYPIAVGRQGLETPAGLYDVQWKEVNPPWHVPNDSWAGALAGRTIPPGPQDPIKARWLAFDGGAGIHGTDETSSIGTSASHGCIRMLIPDVIQLYSVTPVHSPVYVA